MENNLQIITEKNYPITLLWVYKAPIIIFITILVLWFFGYYNLYLILAFLVMLIANPRIRANFHYSLDDKFLNIKQGVFSKKQRNLPYGVIQNVFIKQDVFDRIFKLATLRIENAAQGGRENMRTGSFSLTGVAGNNENSVGSSGNKVNIPGLSKQNAEELKNCILNKIKENPIEDAQSGL